MEEVHFVAGGAVAFAHTVGNGWRGGSGRDEGRRNSEVG
jgi:hypothetical protein